jgi:hypothetical protein
MTLPGSNNRLNRITSENGRKPEVVRNLSEGYEVPAKGFQLNISVVTETGRND